MTSGVGKKGGSSVRCIDSECGCNQALRVGLAMDFFDHPFGEDGEQFFIAFPAHAGAFPGAGGAVLLPGYLEDGPGLIFVHRYPSRERRRLVAHAASGSPTALRTAVVAVGALGVDFRLVLGVIFQSRSVKAGAWGRGAPTCGGVFFRGVRGE